MTARSTATSSGREDGLFEQIWSALVPLCDDLRGVQWQPTDAMLGNGPRATSRLRLRR